MDLETFKFFSQFGLAGLLVLAIGWVIYRVGLRMIAAIDAIRQEVANHTRQDLEAHAEVREAVAAGHGELKQELVALNTRVETALDLTPGRGLGAEERRTPGRGVPAGQYGPLRPRTRNDGDR